jgi:hypothetical protein
MVFNDIIAFPINPTTSLHISGLAILSTGGFIWLLVTCIGHLGYSHAAPQWLPVMWGITALLGFVSYLIMTDPSSIVSIAVGTTGRG